MMMMLLLVLVSLGVVASGGRFARLSTVPSPPSASQTTSSFSEAAQALVRVEESRGKTDKGATTEKKKRWSPIMSSARSIYRR
jgi:hypothetical protein